MIVLRELLPRLKMLKIVLMSAALNIQLFYTYFGGCPVISGIYVGVVLLLRLLLFRFAAVDLVESDCLAQVSDATVVLRFFIL